MNAVVFSSVFMLTIFLTRAFLYFVRIASPTVSGFRVHHYMYGLFLLLLGIMTRDVIVVSIGYGLFLDEAPCLLSCKAFGYKEYSSKKTKLLLMILIVISIGISFWRLSS